MGALTSAVGGLASDNGEGGSEMAAGPSDEGAVASGCGVGFSSLVAADLVARVFVKSSDVGNVGGMDGSGSAVASFSSFGAVSGSGCLSLVVSE